jgi:hypothetical protein
MHIQRTKLENKQQKNYCITVEHAFLKRLKPAKDVQLVKKQFELLQQYHPYLC